MFARWGALVYRFRRYVVVFSILLAIASLSLASQTSSELSSGGWFDNNSESADVQRRLDEEFGAGKGSLIALFRADEAGADARSPEFQAAISTALAGLVEDERVTGVVGYAETGEDRFISTDGDAAYVVVQLGITNEESVDQVEELREEIQPPAGYTYQLTGYGPLTVESAAQSERDLQRAELVSLPVAAVVLILVFGAVLAAGTPLFVAGLAIPASLALIYLVAQQVEMSIYVVRAFLQLRDLLASNRILAKRLDELEARIARKLATHDDAISDIIKTIRSLMRPAEPKRRGIGFTAKFDDE